VHVGLNLIYLVPGETGGTETYARELLPALRAAAPDLQITAFAGRELAAACPDWLAAATGMITVPVNSRNRVQWVVGEQLLLPPLAARAGVELIHSLANTAPAHGRFRRVATIHDLHFKLVPEAHRGLLGLGMSVLVPLAARSSHRIVTDSHSTAADLERHLRIDRSRVDVVPLGFGFSPTVEPLPGPELRRRLQLDGRPLVLSVAAKRPHKNLARLIDAIASIPAERRPQLVIPGYPTPYERELRDRAARLGVSGEVRLLGWVEPGELEGLYHEAACLVCPSLHEGFGLPVLEAMARGLPVACSARGALAEVAGDAALVFDPTSREAIAAAIERLLGSPADAARLRALGPPRARQFTWEATAASTLAVYERTLLARSSEALA
jgi:glycosyltransferase involved in cell wall biosynthesis